MLLGGLWHGASWTFVFWGAYHGVGQIIGRRRRAARVAQGLPAEPEGRGRVAWARFVTFQVVCLGWLFFRSDTLGNAFAMLSRLVVGWGPSPARHPAGPGRHRRRHRQSVPARRLAEPGA